MSGTFLYIVTGAFCLGVSVVFLFGLGSVSILALLAIAAACMILAAVVRAPKLLLVAAALAALSVGIARADIYQQQVAQENLATFDGQKVLVDGVVANDPEQSGAYLHANVQVSTVDGAPARGELLAFVSPQERLSYGQIVEVSGTMQAPQAFMGDAGNMFDYPGYLRVQGVSMTLENVQVHTSQLASLSLLGVLYSFKHRFDASLEKLLPQPEASVLEGILLGERRGLPAAVEQAFVIAGLIHIVILSGYSMSVVSEGVLRSLKFLPRRAQTLCAALIMILFVLMTGAAATTVRACAMALVALVARYFHRSSLALRSLVLVAGAMILWNPPVVLEDASFIVSVLATFGLIVFAPSIERLLKFIKNAELRSIITSTIAVQIFALPMLLYYTGNVSLFSVPANLLVLPLLPFIMALGLVVGLFAFVNPLLALVPAFIVDILLRWILLIVALVQAIPFSATTLFAFPLWAALLCYVPLILAASWTMRQNAFRRPTSLHF